MIRLFGSLGGYMSSVLPGEVVDIRVHMYFSGTISSGPVKLHLTTNWPWDRKISFVLESNVQTSVKLRIPGWATEWKATFGTLIDGYLHISPEDLRVSPTFELDIKLVVRELRPHPFCNQDTIALARGPIVYCLEDVDNDWVTDHFKVGFPFVTRLTLDIALQSWIKRQGSLQ
jgi:uncharacterized protein